MGTFAHLAGRPLVLGQGTGSVIEIPYGEPDVWITDNRLAGGISLHGFVDPGFEEAFDGQATEESLHGMIAVTPRGKGTLTVEGNRLDWIRCRQQSPKGGVLRLRRVGRQPHRGTRPRHPGHHDQPVRELVPSRGRATHRLIEAVATTVVGNIGPQANPILRVVATSREVTANA